MLRKYGVGCAIFHFPLGGGGGGGGQGSQYEPAECVVFPWMVEGGQEPPSSSAAAAAAAAPTAKRATRGRRSKGAVVVEEEEEGQGPGQQAGSAAWVPKRCKIRAMKEKAWQRWVGGYVGVDVMRLYVGVYGGVGRSSSVPAVPCPALFGSRQTSPSQHDPTRLHPTGAGWGLFGLHTVAADAKEVVLTEGEFDAMAVYQVKA